MAYYQKAPKAEKTRPITYDELAAKALTKSGLGIDAVHMPVGDIKDILRVCKSMQVLLCRYGQTDVDSDVAALLDTVAQIDWWGKSAALEPLIGSVYTLFRAIAGPDGSRNALLYYVQHLCDEREESLSPAEADTLYSLATRTYDSASRRVQGAFGLPPAVLGAISALHSGQVPTASPLSSLYASGRGARHGSTTSHQSLAGFQGAQAPSSAAPPSAAPSSPAPAAASPPAPAAAPAPAPAAGASASGKSFTQNLAESASDAAMAGVGAAVAGTGTLRQRAARGVAAAVVTGLGETAAKEGAESVLGLNDEKKSP